MFGLISKLKSHAGQRDALAHVLLQACRGLPGCVHYIVAKDIHDHNVLWVVETWESSHAYQDALTLPQVVEGTAQAKPLTAAIERRMETVPVTV